MNAEARNSPSVTRLLLAHFRADLPVLLDAFGHRMTARTVTREEEDASNLHACNPIGTRISMCFWKRQTQLIQFLFYCTHEVLQLVVGIDE